MIQPTKPGVLPLEQARQLVEQRAAQLRPGGMETVPLLDAAGRVLAQQVRADRDFPPFPRSTRDGYAVRSSDLATVPARLKVVGEIRAGQPVAEDRGELRSGEAVAIMTGAPLPPGADAVVMLEYAARDRDQVLIERSAAAGENYVPAGAEARAGDVLLAPGERIGHAAIAVAASVGLGQLPVWHRPRVAVLATGDEIVDVAQQPGPHQIRNSNTYSLAAQLKQAGAEPILLPVAPDEAERLHELLAKGLAADLLLIAGGVSMGRYDLVEETLSEFGAEFFFTGALIQPGKPVVFGRCHPPGQDSDNWRYFLGLPGNPVSTMVTFEIFVRPLVNALSGAPAGKLRFVQARLKFDVHTKTGLTRFLPGILTGEYHRAEVELVPWKGSGDVVAQARSNCYVVVPRDRDHLYADSTVDVLLA